MAKYLLSVFIGLFVFGFLFLGAQAASDTTTLSTDVQPSLSMVLSSNTYDFGNLTANAPEKGSAGIDIDVTTNATNGYTLAVSDSVAGNGSALLHTDLTTRISDFSAPISLPELWVDTVSKGLGITVYAADTDKETKWGVGTTYDDSNNKYAGVPQNATTIHTSAGHKMGDDTTSVAFIVDVNPDQKPGTYSGDVTFTATAVLM